ncbi:MAG: hypothetical protein RMH84_05025 [Sulfolobales archaeon]|nr:hypothetical protein [Sulfolobales archaeon]MCX8209161.1 hypothetical protein [Sulfolobales archaeon]MDW8010936.1 hypothetical protein [Sulfolobales archaeon]
MSVLRSRVFYLLLVTVVALSSIPPAVVAIAQAESADGRARELLEAVSATVARLREMGVNVSKAEELLARAREALEGGDVGRARSLALLALVAAGSKARETLATLRPVAAGVLVEVAALKKLVKELGYAELELRIREAEELYSKGLVNESVKVLREIREAIRFAQEKLRKTIVVRARTEVEAALRTKITEEKLAEELARTLRKAENLSAIGKTLRAVRAYEKLRGKVNISISELDKDLANLSEKSAAFLRAKLGNVLDEVTAHLRPLGLVESVKAKIRFIEKLRGRLPEDLKPVAGRLVEALVELSKAVARMLKCEEDYVELLKEVQATLADILRELSAKLPPRVLPVHQKGSEVADVVLLYAVAKWSYVMANSLQRIVVCPEVGSEVVFKGIVVGTGNQTLAFGTMKTPKLVPIEPVYIEDIDLKLPRIAIARMGIFILDLGKLENVSLSVGDVVRCVGRYLGYRESDKYPTIEVRELWKLVQVEKLVED